MHIWKRSGWRLAVALPGLPVLLLLAATVRGAPRDQGPRVSVGCATHAVSVPFVVQQPDASGALSVTAPGAAGLDVMTPRVAVTCQAVVWGTDARGDPVYAVDPGTVTFSVIGPGVVVEAGAQSYSIACGVPDQTSSCLGADEGAAAVQGAVTGSPALTAHVALAAGATLPALPALGAIQVQAVFASTAGSASAATAIDLVPAQVSLAVTLDRQVAGSDVADTVAINVRLRHAVPTACSPVGSGAFVICLANSFPETATGVEAGIVSFRATIGTFPNGLPRIDAVCGTPAALPLVVPATDVPAATLDCREVTVKLNAAGHAGDAVVAVSFLGSETRATAGQDTRVTFVPGPQTIGLPAGCTGVQVPAHIPPGSAIELLVGSIQPPGAVTSIWHATRGGWLALYLRNAAAPVDGATVDPGDGVVVCVSAPARYPLS